MGCGLGAVSLGWVVLRTMLVLHVDLVLHFGTVGGLFDGEVCVSSRMMLTSGLSEPIEFGLWNVSMSLGGCWSCFA